MTPQAVKLKDANKNLMQTDQDVLKVGRKNQSSKMNSAASSKQEVKSSMKSSSFQSSSSSSSSSQKSAERGGKKRGEEMVVQDLPPQGDPNQADAKEPAKKKQTMKGRRASLYHKPTFKEQPLLTENDNAVDTEMAVGAGEASMAGGVDGKVKKKATKKANRNRRQSVMPSTTLINQLIMIEQEEQGQGTVNPREESHRDVRKSRQGDNKSNFKSGEIGADGNQTIGNV